MKLALTLLLLTVPAFARGHKSAPTYSFDPQSLIKTEYNREDCRRDGEWVKCSRAFLTFGAIRATDPVPSTVAPSAFVGPASTASDGGWIVSFNPSRCSKEPDRAGRHVCRDVKWREKERK